MYAYTGGKDKNQINIEKIKNVIEERADCIFSKWEYNRVFMKWIVAFKVPLFGRILLKLKKYSKVKLLCVKNSFRFCRYFSLQKG